jgi:3,4-dihydroxy 2-butanone 4-phosphate synthase/GTP cyclohydrolase II
MFKGVYWMPSVQVPEAIERLRQGEMLIVVDEAERENEGDFICAAEQITTAQVNFMAQYGRGLICVPTTGQRLQELEIPMMVTHNSALLGTAFTVSVDYKIGTTTGISAHDRALTIQAMVDPEACSQDFGKPGHIFPLCAVEGGVLNRAGHTEAVVDLLRLAGMKPVGVLCEILAEDGSMARMPRLEAIATEHGLAILTLVDLIEYRMRTERLIQEVASADLPTRFGHFHIHGYSTRVDHSEHLALVKGTPNPSIPTLVRIHSSCLTGDLLGSLRCDCGFQFHLALEAIGNSPCGVLLYLNQEGRGIGLLNKIMAYHLQDGGADTVEANEQMGFKSDLRDYGIGAQILHDLGVRRMKLMTNNPKKVAGLAGYHLEIVETIPLVTPPTKHNRRYLETKRDKMGHELPLGEDDM